MGSVNWFIWRPIIARKVTLQEIECHYSLLDLQLIHEAMDIEAEIKDYGSKNNR